MQPHELSLRDKLSNIMKMPFQETGKGVLALARKAALHHARPLL